MGNIVTVGEVAQFLKMKDADGNSLVPTADTDPSSIEIEALIAQVEADFEHKTYQAYGHIVQTEEYHDLRYSWEAFKGIIVYLSRIHCHDLDTDAGDFVKIKINNVLSDITRDVDHFNTLEGIVWVRYYGLIDPHPRLLVKYRYGLMDVPADVKLAVLKSLFIQI